ncbi:hypothetical protein P3T35_003132 [Kitasatospora sp. GP30]|uniref:hypothetical protein n=1 Tax=Kitasatospora sp. GP30 TaxID=3035084 RepID=UPI000C703182|nr:hypothetical protein [Kitasatospora sp. GP30]MDH6141119.1 hypothetical protein [Kitasatospora sp. GP30]
MSDTTTARDELRAHLVTGVIDAMYRADTLIDTYRDQVLTEAAELLRQHRGDLCDGYPWWDTRDRDTAIAVLLAARAATAQED